MSKKRIYLNPVEVEGIMNEAREKSGIYGVIEEKFIKNSVEHAKKNTVFQDKTLMCIEPIYIHIPAWQRKLYLPRATEIGNNYNSYKWEVPKVLFCNGKLTVVDGMHRIFGAFLGKIDTVVIEVITGMSEPKAINLFLEQESDRRRMSPSDKYGAALKAKKPEYIKLKEICDKNHIQVKGDTINVIDNPIGILTSISDGVGMAKTNPELLNRILKMLNKLQWNGGKISNEGNAYSAKVLRVFKKLYAYYSDRTEAMERVLVKSCKGSEFFKNNIMEKWQDTMFDYLAAIIEQNINILSISDKKTGVCRKTKNA